MIYFSLMSFLSRTNGSQTIVALQTWPKMANFGAPKYFLQVSVRDQCLEIISEKGRFFGVKRIFFDVCKKAFDADLILERAI